MFKQGATWEDPPHFLWIELGRRLLKSTYLLTQSSLYFTNGTVKLNHATSKSSCFKSELYFCAKMRTNSWKYESKKSANYWRMNTSISLCNRWKKERKKKQRWANTPMWPSCAASEHLRHFCWQEKEFSNLKNMSVVNIKICEPFQDDVRFYMWHLSYYPQSNLWKEFWDGWAACWMNGGESTQNHQAFSCFTCLSMCWHSVVLLKMFVVYWVCS